jgi:hypothetical protein
LVKTNASDMLAARILGTEHLHKGAKKSWVTGDVDDDSVIKVFDKQPVSFPAEKGEGVLITLEWELFCRSVDELKRSSNELTSLKISSRMFWGRSEKPWTS